MTANVKTRLRIRSGSKEDVVSSIPCKRARVTPKLPSSMTTDVKSIATPVTPLSLPPSTMTKTTTSTTTFISLAPSRLFVTPTSLSLASSRPSLPTICNISQSLSSVPPPSSTSILPPSLLPPPLPLLPPPPPPLCPMHRLLFQTGKYEFDNLDEIYETMDSKDRRYQVRGKSWWQSGSVAFTTIATTIATTAEKSGQTGTTAPSPSVASIPMLPRLPPSTRQMLLDWVLETTAEQFLSHETVYQAINHLDRFLDADYCSRQQAFHHVSITNLQEIMVTCLWIASKNEATDEYMDDLTLDHMATVMTNCEDEHDTCKKSLLKQRLLQWESRILHSLDFYVNPTTPHLWCQYHMGDIFVEAQKSDHSYLDRDGASTSAVTTTITTTTATTDVVDWKWLRNQICHPLFWPRVCLLIDALLFTPARYYGLFPSFVSCCCMMAVMDYQQPSQQHSPGVKLECQQKLMAIADPFFAFDWIKVEPLFQFLRSEAQRIIPHTCYRDETSFQNQLNISRERWLKVAYASPIELLHSAFDVEKQYTLRTIYVDLKPFFPSPLV